jgi:hypothetical protein
MNDVLIDEKAAGMRVLQSLQHAAFGSCGRSFGKQYAFRLEKR